MTRPETCDLPGGLVKEQALDLRLSDFAWLDRSKLNGMQRALALAFPFPTLKAHQDALALG